MRRRSRGLLVILALAILCCHRERRSLMPTAADSERPMPLRVGGLQP